MFLHGFPEGAWVWDALLLHFSEPKNGGYRCVAPNLRGFERSSAPKDVKEYRVKHLVQDILALIDIEAKHSPLAALVAHDWGGALAWNLANQHPRRLRQLVIVNAPHPGPLLQALQNDPAQQAASAYMNFLVQPEAAAQLSADNFQRLFGFITGQDASLASLTAHSCSATSPDWLTPQVQERYREVWRYGLQGGLNYYRASPLRPATANDLGATAVQIPAEALRIDVPTLLLWAQDDVALLPSLTDGLDAHIADLKIVPIENATHWVVHERPERLTQEISAFLKPNVDCTPPKNTGP